MIAVLLALLVINQPAWFLTGDDKKTVKPTCPVDGTVFEAVELKVSNNWGGRDTDGCDHAFKTTPLEFLVWTCPTCRFTGRKDDFAAKLGDEEKQALKAELKPLQEIPKGAKQAQIPGHVKYDLLAQVARIRKA